MFRQDPGPGYPPASYSRCRPPLSARLCIATAGRGSAPVATSAAASRLLARRSCKIRSTSAPPVADPCAGSVQDRASTARRSAAESRADSKAMRRPPPAACQLPPAEEDSLGGAGVAGPRGLSGPPPAAADGGARQAPIGSCLDGVSAKAVRSCVGGGSREEPVWRTGWACFPCAIALARA
eukprot:scaffold1081_cov112-Isochrysis_galbana.AAC.2